MNSSTGNPSLKEKEDMSKSFDSNDKRWRSGVFRAGRLKLFSAFIIMLVMLLLSYKILTAENDAYGPFLHWKKLLGVVHIFTLASFVWLVKVILRSWRFRGSKFVMEDMPGVIGGDFRGVLVLPDSFAHECKIKVEIVNLKTSKESRGAQRDRVTKTTRLYSNCKYIPVSCGQAAGRLIKVPVEFTIPFYTRDETDNEKETSMGRDCDVSYKWMLTARAEIKGADLDLDFEVPIFRTDQSDRNVKEPAIDIYELQKELLETDGPERIQVIEESGCNHYAVKGKDRVGYVFCGLFGFCSLSAAVFFMDWAIKAFKEVDGSAMMFLLAVVQFVFLLAGTFLFGLIGVFAVIRFLRSLGKKETWVDFGYLRQRGKFFIYSWEKKIDLGRVKDVVSVMSSSREYYESYRVIVTYEPTFSVLSKTNKGPKVLEIAGDISSKAEANWLKEELLEAIIEKV